MGNPFSLQDFFSRDFAVCGELVLKEKTLEGVINMNFKIGMFRFYVYSEMLLGECALNLLMIRKDSSKENNTLMGIRVRNVIIFV